LLTHQLFVYANDVNIFGGNVHNIKKIKDALVVPSKETGLKVNSDETRYSACLETRRQDLQYEE